MHSPGFPCGTRWEVWNKPPKCKRQARSLKGLVSSGGESPPRPVKSCSHRQLSILPSWAWTHEANLNVQLGIRNLQKELNLLNFRQGQGPIEKVFQSGIDRVGPCLSRGVGDLPVGNLIRPRNERSPCRFTPCTLTYTFRSLASRQRTPIGRGSHFAFPP